MEKLTLDDLIADLKAIIAEHGEDYVYKADERANGNPLVACKYFEGGQPSCIFGHVFTRHRIDGDAVETVAMQSEDIDAVLAAFFETEKETLEFASFVQIHQDAGGTWGEAINSALNEALVDYPGDHG